MNPFKSYYSNSNLPKPHSFATVALHSDTGLLDIVSEVGKLLPQLSNFISQFDTTVVKTGVNVITDTAGSMSIDVPNSMSDVEANNISTRLGIIDRLIITRGQDINDLLQKGLALENKTRLTDPNYVSQIADKVQEFKKLNASYKH